MTDVISNRQQYYLDSEFLEEFTGVRPVMSVPALVTTLRTYSATVDGRSEEWWQICKRVVEGTMSFVKWHEAENGLNLDWSHLDNIAKIMYRRMFEMKWVPAGRGLQHMGRDVVWVKGGGVLNSCAFISTKDIDIDFSGPFQFLMDMSMLGVGVGFDVGGAGKALICPPRVGSEIFVVGDTREGWLALQKRILDAFDGSQDVTLPCAIDFHEVRKEGEILKTMGGLSSGPGPLIRMVWDLFEVLSRPEWKYTIKESEDGLYLELSTESECWSSDPEDIGYLIDSIIISDIMNLSGKCVVSGGIRRSAELGMSPIEDIRFRTIKSKQYGVSKAWQRSHEKRYGFSDETRNSAWRWAANNSHVLDTPLTYGQAKEIGESVVSYGDPGIFNRFLARSYGRLKDGRDYSDFQVEGCNPCGEQPLENGELCNLIETVPSRHLDMLDFIQTCLVSYFYGKVVSLIPTHNQETNQIIQRNRRMGVSQTGVFLALEKLGKKEYIRWCESGYAAIKREDEIWSNLFRVSKSVRLTSLKPSGTVSKVLDVPSGLRADEAPYYILRIQLDKTSPLIPLLEKVGYPVLQSVQSASAMVVEFPCTTGCTRGVADISPEEQLDMIEMAQTYWSDNMVSNTVQFQKKDVPRIPELIYDYGRKLKSLSFLCYDGHKFEQAPYEAIDEEEYKKRISFVLPIDYSSMSAYSVHDQDDKFCEGIACEVNFGTG